MAGTTVVYDIVVEPQHNFFANGLLVHNKSLYIAFNWSDDGAEPVDTDGDGLVDSGCGDSLGISWRGDGPGRTATPATVHSRSATL